MGFRQWWAGKIFFSLFIRSRYPKNKKRINSCCHASLRFTIFLFCLRWERSISSCCRRAIHRLNNEARRDPSALEEFGKSSGQRQLSSGVIEMSWARIERDSDIRYPSGCYEGCGWRSLWRLFKTNADTQHRRKTPYVKDSMVVFQARSGARARRKIADPEASRRSGLSSSTPQEVRTAYRHHP